MNYQDQTPSTTHTERIKLAQIPSQVTQFCKELDIPIAGVTLFQGRPYVNKIGLLSKAHKIGLLGIEIEPIKNAWESKEMSASYKATVTMRDGSKFEDEGWASLQSVKMSTLKNPDYINMMAITRAKNRALGNATGCGYISAEELDIADQIQVEPKPRRVETKPPESTTLPLNQPEPEIKPLPISEPEASEGEEQTTRKPKASANEVNTNATQPGMDTYKIDEETLKLLVQ